VKGKGVIRDFSSMTVMQPERNRRQRLRNASKPEDFMEVFERLLQYIEEKIVAALGLLTAVVGAVHEHLKTRKTRRKARKAKPRRAKRSAAGQGEPPPSSTESGERSGSVRGYAIESAAVLRHSCEAIAWLHLTLWR
jgi:hypothetical protein